MSLFKYRHPAPEPQPKNVYLPSGTAIKTDAGWYYIKGNTKIRIVSERVLDSWSFDRVVYVTDECAARYKTQGRMGFREGSAIEDIATSEKFLISENKRRKIMSPQTLDDLGITDFMLVSHGEAGIHLRGEDL